MALDESDETVLAGDELYVEDFHASIEQSAIYSDVLFECVREKLPAIVLTPQCSILHPRGELLLTVSGVFPAAIVFEQFLKKKDLPEVQIAGLEPAPKKPYEGFSKEFKQYYLKNRVLEFHFLPAYKNTLPHSFVDFRIVKTLEAKELTRRKKIAVLKPPWRECVPSRYAAYSLRVGVREFADDLLDNVIEKVSTVRVS